MRKITFLLSLIVVIFTVHGQNLLKNPDFQKLAPSQLPESWFLNKPDAGNRITLPDGTFALQLQGTQPKDDFFWIQHGVKIQPGYSYTFQARVKADRGTTFLVYVESNKPTFKAFSSKWQNGTGEWQDIQFPIQYEAMESLPYAVLRMKGAGTAQFAKPEILVRAVGRAFVNGDFTQGLQGWQISGDAKIADQGGTFGQALELNGRNAEENPKAIYPDIQLKGGKSYLLSYQVKGTSDKNLSDSMNATWFRVHPVIDGQIPADAAIWRDCFSSWQQKQVTFKVENDAIVQLVCELRAPGQVWFDQISLQESTLQLEPLAIQLDPPTAYRDGIYSTMPKTEQLTGQIRLALPGVRQLQVKLAGAQSVYPVKSDSVSFTLPVPVQVGSYSLEVTAFGENQQELGKTSLPFTVYPPAEREVTFRDDHVMLVNGQPFFPLGVWGAHGNGTIEEKAAAFAKAGFNVWMTGMGNLDLASRNGMFVLGKVIERLPKLAADQDPKRLEQWKELYTAELKKRLGHPALLGYFISDEPAWRGIPAQPLIESYRFIRNIDPYKPILLNEAPRGKVADLRAYVDAFDAYGVDIYPVPAPNGHSGLADKMMTSVGKYTDVCREVVENRKPIWMTLQGFSWGIITNKPNPVYPTREEDRFMAYNALLHGATGLYWWGINNRKDNPEYLEQLGRTVKEIQALASVLVTRPMAAEIQAQQAEIRLMQRNLNGVNYYFVINESGNPIQAKFTGKLPVQLHVLFENRQLKTGGREFEDAFAPYGVHVYSEQSALPPPLALPELKPVAAKYADLGDDYRQADWIWYPKKNSVPGHRAWFKREFTVENLKKAELFITADDYYQLYLNDVLSGDQPGLNRGWNTVDYYDVTARLKTGSNTMLVRAADAGQAPCGLLCALKLTDMDGKVILITSNADFLASEDGKTGWVPAQAICRFGAMPWGNMVQVVPNDNAHLGKLNF